MVISVLVYFFFRINQERHWTETFVEWDFDSIMYLGYTVLVIMLLWEVVARTVIYCCNSASILTNRGLYQISLKATFFVLPLVVLFSYIFVYYLLVDCNCSKDMDPLSHLWILSAQGFVISLLIISYEIIRLYIRNAVQSARETELIQKELIAARFEGLKNQVNPHFLFNSFSVLISLVETDTEKAVKFIAKLSDMYRYILENDENDVVTIRQELAFLDDYIFLIEMRHQDGLIIEKKFTLKNWEAKVPPMSLQILVENAVKHNAFSAEDPLKIVIQNEGEKFIVVENPKRPKSELVNSTGIGLKNLSKRLSLSLKKGLEIIDDTSSFRVKLPISMDL